MPRHRPPTSGYARISQAEEDSSQRYLDDSDDEDPYQTPQTISASAPQYAPIQPQPHDQLHDPLSTSPKHKRRPSGGRRRQRSNSSGVDIMAINARLERWAEEIASKFKINKVKGKTRFEEQLEIHHSVFQAPEGMRSLTAETWNSDADASGTRMNKIQFDDVVESVKVAIELGVHPKMISQGSSGSYFARNSEGQVVGVFKPKDEEPYASRNPKWTKWIHRNLFPCFFGRACLIPNLSYVSEAAAYVLDSRLQTNLVPYTDIVWLSSKSFFYDFWQRSNYYRKRKPLPAKVGSFQVFLKGFKDANIFLRDHPWPDQLNSGFRPEDGARRKKQPWADPCGRKGVESEDEGDIPNEPRPSTSDEQPQGRKFVWTDTIKQSFREELEKLVILDYIMRNTDRGLDNWMIKVDWETQEVSIASEPPKLNGEPREPGPRPVSLRTDSPNPYRRQQNMLAESRAGTPSNQSDSGKGPSISIGAIDNSLSWPWKHPDAWRSFPFGWLFLPVSLIGQPFSQKTRDHFLPLLTSTHWWSETQMALRDIFSQDSDFKEKMFARQIAVMKGQAWNVVETLKTPDHGPLELTRRVRVCVWDDIVDIPVAIPLARPSAEMRRRADAGYRHSEEEEEMDISVANASAPPIQHDLIGLSPPSSNLPNPNRFELSRSNSSTDPQKLTRIESAATVDGVIGDHKDGINGYSSRPTAQRTRTRLSYEGQRKRSSISNSRRKASYPPSKHGHNLFPMYDGDDLEGDLGYAAAEGMEGNQRKVIMERLETVKTKNPVFTWC
ncbi:MAG: phosphatidyl inositol kinase [Icmadophila ericetorum]|nr:phosphatidyl inositol kinase [Icmadophila ericetorum]